jgi:hypothetical protein
MPKNRTKLEKAKRNAEYARKHRKRFRGPKVKRIKK